MLTGRPFILALDGTEGMEGRALFTLSALTFAGGWSADITIRMIDVTDDNVVLAAEALAWDEGIAVEIRRPGDEDGRGSPLEGAGLYAGAAFRDARHMRLDEVRRRCIPVLAAIQYPDPGNGIPPPPPDEPDAAFDPRRFAAMIGRALRGRRDGAGGLR